MDLSILIPARNEMFLSKTIENILENIEGETEVIAVCDGNWPDPPVQDHDRVHLIYYNKSIGQRAATNQAARMSTAKFIMKADAHCAFGKGFDRILMAECEYDWTVVPRMYNLHAFNWKCLACGNETYQGPTPVKCEKCSNTKDFERVILWKAKKSPETDHMRFDSDLKFQYWSGFKSRPEAQPDLAPTMSLLGACWFMHRQRYWDLDGMDENHGSWGQMGTEVACKSWLSGGKLLVNKRTWFAHMFRTQGGDFSFPYPNPGISTAREYSRHLWKLGQWPKAKYPLSWLVKKFAPVPDWPDEIDTSSMKKGVIYYTDNSCDPVIAQTARDQLKRAFNGEIICVSINGAVDFGTRSIELSLQRGVLTMFKQILAALEASTADIVFFCEHDVLYHPSHFEFSPARNDIFYYNENVWKVSSEDGRALFYYTKQTSGLCGFRDLLLEHYRKRVARVEESGFSRHMGFEPGTHRFPRGVDNYGAERWMSASPNIDVRHKSNLTRNRWSQDKFRNKNACLGWTESDEVPGWGKTKGRFDEFLKEMIDYPFNIK